MVKYNCVCEWQFTWLKHTGPSLSMESYGRVVHNALGIHILHEMQIFAEWRLTSESHIACSCNSTIYYRLYDTFTRRVQNYNSLNMQNQRTRYYRESITLKCGTIISMKVTFANNTSAGTIRERIEDLANIALLYLES